MATFAHLIQRRAGLEKCRGILVLGGRHHLRGDVAERLCEADEYGSIFVDRRLRLGRGEITGVPESSTS